MRPSIEVRGLDELHARFRQFPQKWSKALGKTLQASLLILQGSVPKYPRPPADSTYRRTGMLGRSLGSAVGGGKVGRPDIFEVRKMGGFQEGRFGSRLKYAPYVVGEQQAAVHQGRWWTVPKTVVQRAVPKIDRAFVKLAEALAKYLDKGRNPT
jgi:hypothetical protein